MKLKLTRIILSAILLVVAVVIEHRFNLPMWQLLLIYLVPYLIAGCDVLAEAAESIAEGEPFDEDFLMSVATLGALAIGFLPGAESQFPEAVAVMLFFQVGELFEHLAEDRSRDSISRLMSIRPDVATVVRDGQPQSVSPEEVAVGETILIAAGERVPLDGRIIDGSSSLNTVALTGESLPRDVAAGDEVLSGCVNQSGLLTVEVTKPYGESTVSKIIELVEHAGESKAKGETLITRFARIYTPIVVVAAVVLALVPPLLSGDFAGQISTWLYRALTFLVVSCPCALVISVPLTYFAGIGGASRKGILIKGANYFDALAEAGTVVFDKTGTLTCGEFEVDAVHPDNCDETRLLHLAAHVERHSTHPIAVSLRNAYPDEQDDCEVADVEEVAGQGVRARVNGQVVCVGNERMMEAVGADWRPCSHAGTIVHVAIDGVYVGHVVIADKVKSDSAEGIAALRKVGVERLVMLTGDREEVGKVVAGQLGIDEYHAELLPADKVQLVERLLAEKSGGKQLLFVGDGINDAPVLARADVGVAMGAMGSDAAIEAADVVLMDDQVSKVARAVRIARRTIGIARQNVVFALAVKLAVLVLAAVGLSTMWMAVVADVGVTVLAVLNATRALRA